MFPTYQHNTQAAVSVDFPTVDGETVAPTAVSFVVADAVGNVVVDKTDITLDPNAGTTLTIGVNPEFNIVPDDKTRDLRVMTLTFESPLGHHTVVARYVIEKAEKLVLMDNSWQTYNEAILTRLDLPALNGWDAADEASHIPALVTAHDRMCRLSYRYLMNQNAVMYDRNDPYWIVSGVRYLKEEDFHKWPKDFQNALRRAQLYEADQILQGDPVGEKRRQGVVSETIGESSMFFNARPPLRLALCVSAMEVLSNYIHKSRRIGRA